jgi:hypothetical protein
LDSDDLPATDISAFDETALYNALFATRGLLVAAVDFGGVPLDLRGGALFKHILNGKRNRIALTGGKCGDTSLNPFAVNVVRPEFPTKKGEERVSLWFRLPLLSFIRGPQRYQIIRVKKMLNKLLRQLP